MQITCLNVRYSCKPTCHNRFALACVRLHRALGHALCKGLGPMRRLAFVEKPVERGLGDLRRLLVHGFRSQRWERRGGRGFEVGALADLGVAP